MRYTLDPESCAMPGRGIVAIGFAECAYPVETIDQRCKSLFVRQVCDIANLKHCILQMR